MEKKKPKNQFDKNKDWWFGRAENAKFEGRNFSVPLISPDRSVRITIFKLVSCLSRRKYFNIEELTHLLGLDVPTGLFLTSIDLYGLE